MEEGKEFTLEEVGNCNGQDGKPAYIVHRGRVIDVSNSKLWKDGLHMRRHHAGARRHRPSPRRLRGGQTGVSTVRPASR